MAVYYGNIVDNYIAICWEHPIPLSYSMSAFLIPLSVKIDGVGQSAGNRCISMGSSETTRDTTDFNYWVAGLIDGDGSLLVSKAGYSSAEITLHENEVDALYRIQSVFGGSVKKRTGMRAFRWRLTNRPGMVLLINAINGSLLTPGKIIQLARVCSVLGITPKNADYSIISTTSWFSGFFDAEGSINCKSTSGQLSLSVTQKDQEILDHIADAFGIKGVSHDASWMGFQLRISSVVNLLVFFTYFDNFPLITVPKSADLIILRTLAQYKELGYHLLPLSNPLRTKFDKLAATLVNRSKI